MPTSSLRQKRQGECVLTHDLDYGQILALSGDSAPSVVIFRLRRVHAGLMQERLVEAWPKIEDSLRTGAIVILEEAAVRIRRLLIAKYS